MDDGYIKLFRKMTTWEWYTDIAIKSVFLHCLLQANYKDKKWKGIMIRRGQFVTSYTHLAEETGLSVKQVRRAIAELINTKELEIAGQKRGRFGYSLITVLNYNLYQNEGTIEGTLREQLRAQKGQQHKKDKNIKEIKKKDTPELKNPWVGIASDGEEYYINEKKYHEWNKAHGITEDD